MRYKGASAGFALPTIVIASVVLFAVLVAATGMVSSTTSSLNTQYYEGLAADAAESGAAHADVCLAANSYTSTWGTKSLTPKTDCNGNSVSAQNNYLVSDTHFTTTYTVSPVVNAGTGSQTAKVTGTVSLLRTGGVVWKTYTKTLVIKTGGQIGTNQVVFGYDGNAGPFFATVGADGVMRAVGYNGLGALGNGSLDNTTVPTVFNAPTVNPIVAGFTSFLSVGLRMYALDSEGNAYGAGANGYSALGIGVTGVTGDNRGSPTPTPAQVLIPGKKIRNIVVGQTNTYFITTDNNIYAAGACGGGRLGSNYTISGCSDQPTPVRVNLPTPTPSNQNTIPTDNIVTDAGITYVRMAGGRVYGWGVNSYGQMGNETFADVSTPQIMGTYGNTGQPVATEIATDGDAVYILDSSGNVNSIGRNDYGQMGNGLSSFKVRSAGAVNKCLENTNGDGVSLAFATCNGSANQKFEIRDDNTLYSPSENKCVDNKSANGVDLQLYICNSTAAQKFVWDASARSFYNAQANKCIDNKSGNAVDVWLYTCTGSPTQQYINYNGAPTKFDPTGKAGSVKAIWTDQWSLTVLTTDGEIWSAGLNNSGFFGNGTTSNYQAIPVKFNMPVTATDAVQASYGANTAYENIFAIGTDGKVYGAGGNTYGQLGIGTTSAYESTPKEMSVIDGTNIRASLVQTGVGTTVIYTTNGSVYTVGRNDYGQIGDGTTTMRTTPIKAQYVNNLKSATF